MVVTVNYRLGAMGFLVYGSGDKAIGGNYGLRVSQCVCMVGRYRKLIYKCMIIIIMHNVMCID